MDILSLQEITEENWRAALRLSVRPDQQRFVSDYAPIVALALAKAYLRLGGMTWAPYAVYHDAEMVGFVALAFQPSSRNDYWIFHLFIDQRYQGRGYGKVALQRLIERVKREHPSCQILQLTLHPENHSAQRLYTAAGFLPTGARRWDEPVYQLALHGD